MIKKDVTQTQQQRPGSPRVTLTCLCHSVINHCHSVINHCHSVTNQCHSVINHCQCHSVINHCHSVTNHCHSVINHCGPCQQYLADLMHILVPSHQPHSSSDDEIFTHISNIHNQRQWTKKKNSAGPCLLNKLHGNMSIFFYFAFRTLLKSHFFKFKQYVHLSKPDPRQSNCHF